MLQGVKVSKRDYSEQDKVAKSAFCQEIKLLSVLVYRAIEIYLFYRTKRLSNRSLGQLFFQISQLILIIFSNNFKIIIEKGIYFKLFKTFIPISSFYFANPFPCFDSLISMESHSLFIPY